MRGFGNRYANDFGGNHIDRMRFQGLSSMVCDFSRKFCSTCGLKKPIKGAKKNGKYMICADCQKRHEARA